VSAYESYFHRLDETNWIPNKFSTENDSTLLSRQAAKKQQTAVYYIDRFFRQISHAQIAEKHNISRQKASRSYANAKTRIKKVVKAIGRTSHSKGHERHANQNETNVRILFLHVLFGLSATEIAKLMEMHQAHVSRDIAIVRDRILAGDLEIISVSDGKKVNAGIRKR